MRFKTILLVPSIFLCRLSIAQNGSDSLSATQGTLTMPVSRVAATPANQPVSNTSPATPDTGKVTYMNYKSVYEASTVEEEVKMATERFELTQSQQETWLTAATDRRATEKQSRAIIDSKVANFEKEGAYRGLRASQNTFHETVTGYLTPAQKQALETDRLILQEKQKRIAKLPPPPPPAPVDTVAPVDSSAIKTPEKEKGAGKKSKKKKKAVKQ